MLIDIVKNSAVGWNMGVVAAFENLDYFQLTCILYPGQQQLSCSPIVFCIYCFI